MEGVYLENHELQGEGTGELWGEGGMQKRQPLGKVFRIGATVI